MPGTARVLKGEFTIACRGYCEQVPNPAGWRRLEAKRRGEPLGESEQRERQRCSGITTGYPATVLGKAVALLRQGTAKARRRYRAFVQKGIGEGKRPDLTGGGLIRSLGGWGGIKALRKSGIRLKGDERILGA